MPDTKQTRNIHDTIILSGQLDAEDDGGLYPEDADWVGATAKIRFFEDDRTQEFVLEGNASLTDPSGDTLARYRYVGAIGVLAAGRYIYKIHVTFADLTQLTWPNDKEKFQLEVVAEDS